MTNGWTDIKNTKLALIFSNPAENHPSVMQWINYAKANGARVIVVEPRKTRTAALADRYIRIRPGTDTAFINGLLKYIFDKDKADTAYLFGKTDAPFRLNATDNTATDYTDVGSSSGPARGVPRAYATEAEMKAGTDSVYNYLKRRVSGYTAAEVADICGCPASEFVDALSGEPPSLAQEIADAKAKDGKPMTIMYAMGTTQHSTGSQMIRSYAILQCVLGNVGKPGTGINALRGIHNVQGSTDMGVLNDAIPGYSGNPKSTQTYAQYVDRLFGAPKNSTFNGYGRAGTDGDHWRGWQQVGFRTMMHHFFNQTGAAAPGGGSYFGENEAVNADANFDYDLMPKNDGFHHREMFEKAVAGVVKAMFIFGQNPAVTEANANDVRAGLYELDLLVVTDVFKNETANVGRDDDTGPGRKPTGWTYLLPAASFVERPGSITNSARVLQWRNQVIPPKGDCKSDVEILLRLAKALDALAVNAFSHITGAASWSHGAESAFKVLYQDATADHSGYGWDGVAAFNENTVYTNIYKQMCDWIGQGSGGTVWIYGAAYNPSGGKYGAVSMGVGTNNVTFNDAIYTDLTAANCPAGTKVEVGNLSNVELMTVSGWTGTNQINFTSSFTKSHLAGEPITPRGWYSYHAWSDKIIAKSRSTYDPFDNGLYSRWGFSWLVNRRNFYNYNPCNVGGGVVHRESNYRSTTLAGPAGKIIQLDSVAGYVVTGLADVTIAGEAGFFTIAPGGIDATNKRLTLTAAPLNAHTGADAVTQGATTHSLAAPAGTVVALTTTSGFGRGDFIQIAPGAAPETFTIQVVGTAGTFKTATLNASPTGAYAPAVAAVETDLSTTGSGAKGSPNFTVTANPGFVDGDKVVISGGKGYEETKIISSGANGGGLNWVLTTNLANLQPAASLVVKIKANSQVAVSATGTTVNLAATSGLAKGDIVTITDGVNTENRAISAVVNDTSLTLSYALANSYLVPTVTEHVDNGFGAGSRWVPGYITWCKDYCAFRPGGGDGSCSSPGDARDFFVAPDNKAQLFVHFKTDAPYQYPDPEPSNDVATTSVYRYRAYKTLAEPDGRTPKHWEPWESPEPDLVAAYGTVGVAPIDLPGDKSEYPFILTTFRHTEHFQGGPLTRNVPYLNELVPKAVIEINPVDAAAKGIKNGYKVWLSTARASDIGPFYAVVGNGVPYAERVGKGVLAIPWHWGEVGLAKGPVANKLTIDALDANTKMPETKVCLCKISNVQS